MNKILLSTAMLAVIALSFLLVGADVDAKSDKVILTKTNTLVLNTEVDEMSVSKLMVKAYRLNNSLAAGEPLYLVLNTPGGSIEAGLQLIDNLKALGRPVNTIPLFAASMGFQIVQNLSLRLITQNGILMSHHARGGLSGEFGGQEPTQFSSRYNFWNNKIKEMDLQTVKRTKGKQTLESYTKAYENELWLNAENSVKEGYADQIVSVSCDKSLNGTTDQTFEYFGMAIRVVFSDCPVITGPLDVAVNIKTNSGIMRLEDFQKNGGTFGGACVIANQNKTQILCPDDVTLTLEKIQILKKEVLEKITQNKDKVIKY